MLRRNRHGWTTRRDLAAAAVRLTLADVRALLAKQPRSTPRRWDGKPQARPVTDVATSTYRRRP